MEGQSSSNLVVIDSDGNAFVNIEYLDKIPASPPDEPVRDRFFSETIEVAIPGPALLPHDSQLFVSLNYLNMLLASAQTNPLHVRVITKETIDGYLQVLLRLEDSNGNELLARNQGVDRVDDVTLITQEEDKQQEDVPPVRSEDRYRDRHDTPHEDDQIEGEPVRASNQVDQLDQDFTQSENEQEVLSDAEYQDSQLSQNGRKNVEDNDLEITPLRARLPGDDTVEATPRHPQAQHGQEESSRALFSAPYTGERPYDRALVKQLRDLQLTDRVSLSALVHNHLPPALNMLREAQDDLIHLATLSNGHVCSVKIFRDLRARREDLSFPSLGDPALLDKPMTVHQKNELLGILLVVSKTESGQRLWSPVQLAWPDVWHEYRRKVRQPMDLCTLVQRLTKRTYRTMAQFRRGVDSLVENAVACSGEASAFTAACKLTAQDIYRMMEGICAIQDLDVLDFISHGLLREMVLLSDNDGPALSLQRPFACPRFVLPLGRLYRAERPAEPPRPFHGFVLMDVTTPRKALWLYVLSRDKECCSLVMLAEDITLWELGSGSDNRDGGLMKHEGGTRRHRARLTNTYPDTRIRLGTGKVLFKRADKQQAAEAIKSGWSVVAPAGSRSRQGSEASPLRIALRNSVAQAQGTPTKRRRVSWSEFGDDNEDDEDWVPASERKNIRRGKKAR